MLDFGEELSLESYRIPWLIWIQLIVLFLLLALFFLLSFDDSSTASSSASASASASTNHRLQKPQVNNNHHVSTSTALTNRLQHTRGAENVSIKGEIETSGSTRTVREEIAEREGSASPLYFLHPCHYFKLARVAVLKCLGLDSTESDSPPIRKPRKRKES
ncbi:hypothetical protein PIB30_055582 [Stylosanthes scabra]|uniref:Uncharacterized protein n=1 Tax=Stylosanthes scabra TaxID=79078 RepID=A0ABU6TJJ1_9FABA|nr:hypothetical protein [Stylosanthes scabra]